MLKELTLTDDWYIKLANEIRLKIKLHRCKLLTNYDFEVKLSSRLYEQGSDALKGWICNAMRMDFDTAPFQFELEDNMTLKVIFPKW